MGRARSVGKKATQHINSAIIDIVAVLYIFLFIFVSLFLLCEFHLFFCLHSLYYLLLLFQRLRDFYFTTPKTNTQECVVAICFYMIAVIISIFVFLSFIHSLFKFTSKFKHETHQQLHIAAVTTIYSCLIAASAHEVHDDAVPSTDNNNNTFYCGC